MVCGEEWPADGKGEDFTAGRQTFKPIQVWNVNGVMCIAQKDDPIYITKQQAMDFFDLKE
jgi:hypothetical protein